MPRKVFYSFHYQRDSWRASKIRNIGAVEGNPSATDNKWEEVKRGGDAAIKRWIDDQLQGRTCTIVLVGAETANRPWIRYEIEQSWNSGKGLLGIRIHKLLDHNQQPSAVGANPFDSFTLNDGRKLSTVVRVYDPPGATSSAGLHLYQRKLVELDRSSDRHALEVRALRQTTIRYSWGTHRVPRFATGIVSVHRS